MTLLQKAKPETAFLKMGIYGEAGSGKTFTSSKIAIGLHRYIKSKKPVAFLDTETGSDFMIPVFGKEKIEFLVAKSRAFLDLLNTVDEAEKNCDILIIDSITHLWNEMCESYCKEHNISRITLKHWQPVKQTWREFTKRFVNSKLHIVMAGRSADKWDDVPDEEGALELKKVGTKMRSETEIGYEPSLLVEMVQINKSPRAGSGWIHRVWIIKDRWNEQSNLEGKCFDNPTFESFLPHIELLNFGGEHRAIDIDRNSSELFKRDNVGAARYRKRDQLLEKIKNEIYLLYPSQNTDDKTKRLEIMKKIFGTHAWKEIEYMQNDDLENGLKTIEKQHKTKEKKDVATA